MELEKKNDKLHEEGAMRDLRGGKKKEFFSFFLGS